MGYPYKESKIGRIAQERADKDDITFEEACRKYGFITLEDPVPPQTKGNIILHVNRRANN